ncbi:hypothetical protein [Ornithinibacillus sp. JPR2-1]|uniref:hypothetical protein n=1 Tax=Ornithinibacillus sp. JPR2-1 TaxID=2094019 RepID=UPI0031E417D1
MYFEVRRISMKTLYHKTMFRINAFLFGIYSTKAHKHAEYLAAYGFKEGLKQAERK